MTNPFLTPPAAQAPAAAAQAPAAPAQAQAPEPAPAAAAQAAGPAAIGGVPSVDSSDPFASPSGGGDGSRISDDLGAHLVLRPSEYVPTINTSQGATDAVRADWIVLDGPNAGQVRTGALIFQKVLKSELRSIMGTAKPMMVALLTKGEARNGNSAPYLFAEASDAARGLAGQAASAHGWI